MKKPVNLLAFDFGLRRIGVAVGQTVTHSASAQATLFAEGGVPDWQQVERLIEHWSPDALVVGLPYNMDGSDQAITLAARGFATCLEKRFHLPVYLVDERLTTKEARSQLAEQGKLSGAAVDSYAAKLILEDWLRAN